VPDARSTRSLRLSPREPISTPLSAPGQAYFFKHRRLRAITPLIGPSAYRWEKAEDRDLRLAGLRLASGETD
jgi:hypothetical protein